MAPGPPTELMVSTLGHPGHRSTCHPRRRCPYMCIQSPVVSEVSPDDPGPPRWGQMGQRSSLPAPPEWETPPGAKESGNPSCPLRDSGSPSSLENPPPQPLSHFLCLSPRDSCECTGGLREAPCACDERS